MYFHCTYVIPLGDDVCYGYKLSECPIGTPNYALYSEDTRINNIKDLAESMSNHYMYSNGRHIIHTIIQVFVGMVDYKGYNVFMALVMMLTMMLFVRYTCPKKLWNNPLPYLILQIAYLYLFQVQFPRITFGMNYLFPMMLVLGWLLGMRYVSEHRDNVSVLCMIVLILLSVLTGWSHEGFAIPLSGGAFFYCLLNFKRVTRREWLLIVALWVGALVLFVSPANFARVVSEDIVTRFHRFFLFVLLSKMKIVWLSIPTVLFFIVFSRQETIAALRNHTLLFITVVLSLGFSSIANTGVWSLCPLEFYSLILAFVLFFSLKEQRILGLKSRWNYISLAIVLMIAAHQFIIISSERNLKRNYDHTFNEYLTSPNNYFKVVKEPIPAIANNWLKNWQELDYLERGYMQFTIGISKKTYSYFIGEKDYQAFYYPEQFFKKRHLIPGSGKVYQGDLFLWIKKHDYNPDKRYTLHYGKPIPSEAPYFLLSFKALFSPESFDDSEDLQHNSMLQDNINDSIVGFPILQSMWRHIDSVSAE